MEINLTFEINTREPDGNRIKISDNDVTFTFLEKELLMSPGCADHPGCDHGLIVSAGGKGAGGVSQGVHHHLLCSEVTNTIEYHQIPNTK